MPNNFYKILSQIIESKSLFWLKTFSLIVEETGLAKNLGPRRSPDWRSSRHEPGNVGRFSKSENSESFCRRSKSTGQMIFFASNQHFSLSKNSLSFSRLVHVSFFKLFGFFVFNPLTKNSESCYGTFDDLNQHFILVTECQ